MVETACTQKIEMFNVRPWCDGLAEASFRGTSALRKTWGDGTSSLGSTGGFASTSIGMSSLFAGHGGKEDSGRYQAIIDTATTVFNIEATSSC
ncbi:hypothetical protein PM082_010180 [Marasmius tenuissimus]|nr:hypothetical protein PM082_010180 [Marasmius tenuissimus]